MRVLLALPILLLPAPVLAAGNCAQAIGAMDHALTGAFQRQSDSVLLLNSFPLLASSDHLLVARCPVVEQDGDEASPCIAEVLTRDGEVFGAGRDLPLQGCGPADDYSADCPDYTAEGFTEGNAAALAEALKRSEAQICEDFGSEEVVALTPVPGPEESPAGLDNQTYFERFASCDQLGADASATCAAALKTLGGEVSGVMRIKAGDKAMTCVTTEEGALERCVSD